jgi:hypothetical protein
MTVVASACDTLPKKIATPIADNIVAVSADAAAAFRFLRQPNKPNAPRPVAKSGKAAGSGVGGGAGGVYE